MECASTASESLLRSGSWWEPFLEARWDFSRKRSTSRHTLPWDDTEITTDFQQTEGGICFETGELHIFRFGTCFFKNIWENIFGKCFSYISFLSNIFRTSFSNFDRNKETYLQKPLKNGKFPPTIFRRFPSIGLF